MQYESTEQEGHLSFSSFDHLTTSFTVFMGTSAVCEWSKYDEDGKQDEKMEHLDLGPASNPNQKNLKHRISTENKYNYILSNKSNASLTRMVVGVREIGVIHPFLYVISANFKDKKGDWKGIFY